MITVTRLNNTKLVINAELIQCFEETPDTVITMTNGTKYLVKEKSQELIDLVIVYKQRIFSGLIENN